MVFGHVGRSAVRLYENASRRQPLLVQSSTACTVAAVGDVLMQAVERGRQREAQALEVDRYDLTRTARLALFRLTIFGPGYSVWLRVLDRAVPQSSQRAVVLKVVLVHLALGLHPPITPCPVLPLLKSPCLVDLVAGPARLDSPQLVLFLHLDGDNGRSFAA
jgi:hypothetical protein